ncbi:MAG: HD domain-containing protein [Nitrospira sp.]|nr:HD domain-containing protein [Nitrospira sp.]
MYDHDDILNKLNHNLSLGEKLRFLHEALSKRFSTVDHITASIYDPKTDVLTMFVHSSGGDDPFSHCQVRLAESEALREILEQGRPRLVNDPDLLAAGASEPAKQTRAPGYRSSYTMPMFLNGVFFGFIFFHSHKQDPFTNEALHYLDLFGHLISLIIVSEVGAIQPLLAVVKTAQGVTHHRDTETGAHLDRMSRYARLIARGLADTYHLTDDYIGHVFLFAPLHDIGKIGVSDGILLKPGKLTEQEFAGMQQHVEKGRRIIDEILENFGLNSIQHVEILRNIATCHHEAVNGSGYPRGLKGAEIPIEARIVAVADVFDALTSRRPYKESWSNDEAFATLRRLAGVSLDRECVEALERLRSEVEAVQACFQEDQFG